MSREEALQQMRAGLASLAGPYGDIRVEGVDVQGRCAAPLLRAHIQPLFQATNIDELVGAINKVQGSLFALDIFKDVAISVSPEKIVSIVLPGSNKFVARVGTNVGQSEGSGYVRGSVCNASGWGEIFTVDTSAGTRTKSSHLLSASVPFPLQAAVGWKAEALAYSSEKMLEWSSCRAYVKGVTARLSKGNSSSFGIDAVLRTLMATKLNANNFVVNDAGNSFKLAAFYNWKYDTRVPTETITGDGRGYMMNIHNEVAMRPSTSPHVKSVLKFQSAFRIWRGITGAFNTKTGIIIPLGGAGARTHVLDRLNLGGPLDVRGFRLNHAGPHEGTDALGGDIMNAMGLSIFTPIPRVQSPNIKFHNFWNAGTLGTLHTSVDQLKMPSISTGIGIVYTHPSARFELNFTLPLVARANELVHKGLQFGVGLEFL